MNLQESIKIISRYAPCPHDSYVAIGIGGTWAQCENCGADFRLDFISRYQKDAKQFSEAMDCLNTILKAAQ